MSSHFLSFVMHLFVDFWLTSAVSTAVGFWMYNHYGVLAAVVMGLFVFGWLGFVLLILEDDF